VLKLKYEFQCVNYTAVYSCCPIYASGTYADVRRLLFDVVLLLV